MNDDTTKLCITCDAEKPVSEFHHWQSTGNLMPYCKSCYSHRMKTYKHYPAHVSGIKHQNDLICILRSQGIYAAPGKSSGYINGDVVAWGCVRIEAKLGTQQDKASSHRWKFTFTSKQVNGGLEADNPVFYKDGKFKPAVTINLKNSRGLNALGRQSIPVEILDEHKNNWKLIETKRLEIARYYQKLAIDD